MGVTYPRPTVRDFVGWDVPTWSAAIRFWDRFLVKRPNLASARALDVGANHGGLSLYLASRHEIRTVCTDLHDPENDARPRHQAFGVGDLVTYEALDALAMKYEDATFDYVIFKSVLGEVAMCGHAENKARMMAEVYRVLRPGGAVLFAENLIGTPVHTAMRRLFRKWGKDWGYSTVQEIKGLLSRFSPVAYETTGLVAAFAPFEGLKRPARLLDVALERVVPERFRYVIYGTAVKPGDAE